MSGLTALNAAEFGDPWITPLRYDLTVVFGELKLHVQVMTNLLPEPMRSLISMTGDGWMPLPVGRSSVKLSPVSVVRNSKLAPPV